MPSILNLKFKVCSHFSSIRLFLMLDIQSLFSLMSQPFQGNKSFIAFSNLGDADALTKTWKVRLLAHISSPFLSLLTSLPLPLQVCTKVASFLEQGQRLENLSWRLWHLQNLMVDVDSAKSKREFKRLSKCMSDKLDKEKGRSVFSASSTCNP